MLDIVAGAVRAYYMFDVADTIDIARLRTIEGEGLSKAYLPLRPHASPAYLQFPAPPLLAPLPDAQIDGSTCKVRIKFFDYGVISLRLSIDAAGPWDEYVKIADRVRTDDRFAAYAQATVERVCRELGSALDDPHEALVEDYFVLEVEQFAQPVSGLALYEEHAQDVAALLLNERAPLSRSEINEAFRLRFSYLVDDLTLVQWDTAFVYDRRDSADAIADILEFANSQLLELRTYDALLDRELDVIYKALPGGMSKSLRGRAEAGQAASLRLLIVDVLELTDRASNALKVVGDAYYARIYRAASKRLGLSDWQSQIDTKLESVGDVYRFFSDEARNRRDAFLELTVIALIAVEVIIGVLTLMR